MRGSELLDKLQRLDPDLIQEAAGTPPKPASFWRRVSPLPLTEAREIPLVEDSTPPRKRRPALVAVGGLLCLCLALAPVLIPLLLGSDLTSGSGQTPPSGGEEAGNGAFTGGAHEGESSAEDSGAEDSGAGDSGFYTQVMEQLGVTPVRLFPENGIAASASLADPQRLEAFDDPLAKLFSTVGLTDRSGSPLDWDDCFFITDSLKDLDPGTVPAFSGGKFSAMVLAGGDEESRKKTAPPVNELYAAWRFGSQDQPGAADAIVLSATQEEEDWPAFQAFAQAGNSQSQIDAGDVELHAVGAQGGERGVWFRQDSLLVRIYASAGVPSSRLLEVLGWACSGLAGMEVPGKANSGEGTGEGFLDLWKGSVRQYREGPDAGQLVNFFPPDDSAPRPESIRVLESHYTGLSPCAAELVYPDSEDLLLKSWTVFTESDYHYTSPYDQAHSLGELPEITREDLEESYQNSGGVFEIFFQLQAVRVRAQYRDLGREATVGGLWEIVSRLQEAHSRYAVAAAWTEDFSPEDYFQHSALPGEKESLGGMFGPIYGSVSGERSFSGHRQALEDKRVMPWSDPNEEFTAWASYDEAGEVDLLTVTWTYLDEDNAPLSWLVMECSPKSRESYADRDWDAGMSYSRTVVNREGTEITAIGFPDTARCISYETEHGWYQFWCDASTNEYELVPLMDFFWLFPVDFEQFAQEKGDAG